MQHDINDLMGEMEERPNDALYIDTETIGFHGMAILCQVAVGDGKIYLIELWREVACETVELMSKIADHEGGVVLFNGAFDWFHICKWYTVIDYWIKKHDCEFEFPVDHIDDIASCEEYGRFGKCLKPRHTVDLMLVARKTEYQSLMERKAIRITRIPTQIASSLAALLSAKVPLKDVYFARYKDPTRRWQVMDIKNDLGEFIPEFKDLVLNFAPSSGLKALAQDALGYRDIVKFTEVEPPDGSRPVESGWAPFATAPLKHKTGVFRYPSKKNNWLDKWPAIGKIRLHIDHWAYSPSGRKYAKSDITYTRGLCYYFGARHHGLGHEEAKMYATTDCKRIYPLPMDDNDSVIACMVGAVRWAGYEIDVKSIERERENSLDIQRASKYNFNSTEVCKTYLLDALHGDERIVLKKNGKLSTGGIILETIAKWKDAEVCDDCYGEGCELCNDGWVPTDVPHKAATRAHEILDFRHAGKRAAMLAKLLMAGRFHASFKVIGALSGRMSGGDGLNAQGIESTKAIRKLFPLAGKGEALSIGDYTAFEVMIMNSVYNDPQLIEDSTSTRVCPYCKGEGCTGSEDCEDGVAPTKLYGIGGSLFFGKTYDEVCQTKGLRGELDLYKRSKSGVLALFYQGEAYTLGTRIGVNEKEGEEGYSRWRKRYRVMYSKIDEANNDYQALNQEGGLGTAITWDDPKDSAETIFGFKRWFTLEIKIMKALFEIGEKPPQEWQLIKTKVVRRDREQTASGASRSAMFGAAFKIQGSIQRAAGNHRVQGSGAAITKGLQVALWKLQPAGVNDWSVKPMNIHDEVPCVHKPELREEVAKVVNDYNQSVKDIIPLIDMKWDSNATSWADK